MNSFQKSLLICFLAFWGKQVYAQEAFITTWETTGPNESITIHTHPDEIYDYDIDWGDGSNSTNVTQRIKHVYASPGSYQVSITGLFPRFYSAESEAFNKHRLKSVDQWGDNQWSSFESAFKDYYYMQVKATDSPDLSNVSSLRRMFENATLFNDDIANWDVSNVEDMSSMFYNAYSFNQDISGWDVSNVRNMGSMFSKAHAFNQDIGGWDVSNVTSMYGMFDDAESFNQDIGDWDTGNVKSMRRMFSRTIFFNQDIGDWNVSNVSNMSAMFHESGAFNQDISGWDVSNVTTMASMFSYTESFNQEIGSWDVSKVQDMSWMFSNAKAFNQDIGAWDVGNVTNMIYMFDDARAFNQDIGGWDVSNVESMKSMFKNARIFNQDIGDWDVGNVTNMYWMFYYAKDFDQNLGSWNIENVYNMEWMFRNKKISLENYDSILIGWASQHPKFNVEFGGGYSRYCLADSARYVLTHSYGWTITDFGEDPDCDSIMTNEITLPISSTYLFPNPTPDLLHIYYDEAQHPHIYAVIYNMQGQPILSTVNQNFIDTSTLEAGSYIIELWSEEQKIHSNRFIKK